MLYTKTFFFVLSKKYKEREKGILMSKPKKLIKTVLFSKQVYVKHAISRFSFKLAKKTKNPLNLDLFLTCKYDLGLCFPNS